MEESHLGVMLLSGNGQSEGRDQLDQAALYPGKGGKVCHSGAEVSQAVGSIVCARDSGKRIYRKQDGGPPEQAA